MAVADSVLLDRVAESDGAAMELLQERYADRLFRFALARLGNREEALDVVQETLIAAWSGAESYRGASSVSTWLFGISRNKVGERRRRRRVVMEPLTLAELLPERGGEQAVEFWDCFGRLDDDDQEIILLVFHQGLSQQEVSDMLGIPVGTVKSRTHYARRRLQKLLKGDD